MQIIGVKFYTSLLKSLLFSFVFGLVALVLLESNLFKIISFGTKAEFYSIFTINIIIYLSLNYCYFNFVNMGETARRIRILWEINDSKDGLTMEEILQKYNSKEIVEKRLDRLISSGQVIVQNSRYFAGKPVMLLASRIIILLKLIVLGKKSEFG